MMTSRKQYKIQHSKSLNFIKKFDLYLNLELILILEGGFILYNISGLFDKQLADHCTVLSSLQYEDTLLMRRRRI